MSLAQSAREIMKKRVHLNDLKVGMFVEDTEGNSSDVSAKSNCFLISSAVEIDCLLKNNVLSVVINTSKGMGLDKAVGSGKVASVSAHKSELNLRFASAEIAAATQTIDHIAPHIRQVLVDVRNGRDIAANLVNDAVDHVLTAALSNTAALLSLLRLKKKDNGTFLHSVAVSVLMVTFGRELGLEHDELRQLGIAGLVHDLGKMRLPSIILQNTGRLTDAEVSVVQTHPYQGFSLLQRMQGIQTTALDVTLFHHEKYDGSGYPKNLKGANIPFSARIAAICDVYDALTTVRPYKRAWSQAEALDLMLRSRGHFDPHLLEAFISRVIVRGKS